MKLTGKLKLRIDKDKLWVGKRLDSFLKDYFEENDYALSLSRSFLGKYIPSGVYINRTAAKNSSTLKISDIVELDLDKLNTHINKRKIEDSVEIPAIKGKLSIIEETDDWLVLNKPAGVAVHPSKGNIDNTLANYVKFYIESNYGVVKGLERGGLVHRLDKPVSGLILFAKTARFQRHIKTAFAQKLVIKRYLATVEPINGKVQLMNVGEKKLIEGYIKRDPGMRLRRVFNLVGDGKYSSTQISLVKGNLARILINTGRTHQIRATLRYLGYAVVGDVLYGSTKTYTDGHINLKCIYIEFIDLNGRIRKYEQR